MVILPCIIQLFSTKCIQMMPDECRRKYVKGTAVICNGLEAITKILKGKKHSSPVIAGKAADKTLE